MFKISADSVRAPRWGPGRLGWSQRRVDGADVIYLAGELDLATAAELRQRLMGVAETSAAATIVLDLSDVRFIDAHSIGVIMAAWKAATCRGRQLQVDGLHGITALIFGRLGLEPILARRPEARDGGRGSGGRGRRAGGVARRRFVGGTHAAG
ncbi:MAG TPA: STAS domain-containing protein [Micromonosporaceae bacterium]|nr:STAS domain-containing protein [Micromonosporaceae bacterium]